MEDRRTMRRFSLRLPCLICVLDDCVGEAVYPTETENICSGGAFLRTGNPLSPGTRLTIELLVQRGNEAPQARAESCVCLTGEVVRCGPQGMAVRFDAQYQIVRIAKLLRFSQARTQWMETLTRGWPPTAGWPPRPVRAAPRALGVSSKSKGPQDIVCRPLRLLPAN
jgi:hypothetical protein